MIIIGIANPAQNLTSATYSRIFPPIRRIFACPVNAIAVKSLRVARQEVASDRGYDEAY
jgi:hypothetical protein